MIKFFKLFKKNKQSKINKRNHEEQKIVDIQRKLMIDAMRKDAEKWRTILHNVEVYDGSGKGQKRIG